MKTLVILVAVWGLRRGEKDHQHADDVNEGEDDQEDLHTGQTDFAGPVDVSK